MIKRIGLLIVAALIAAMMMVATAAPAFAAPRCPDGETQATKGPQGTFVCQEEETQKNPKKTEIQQETFKGAPQEQKDPTVSEEQCRQGDKVKEGPCPPGQEPPA